MLRNLFFFRVVVRACAPVNNRIQFSRLGSREVSGSSALTSEHACAHKPWSFSAEQGRHRSQAPVNSAQSVSPAAGSPSTPSQSSSPRATDASEKVRVTAATTPMPYPQPCMNPPALYHSKLSPLGPTCVGPVGELWYCLPPDEGAEYQSIYCGASSVFRLPF